MKSNKSNPNDKNITAEWNRRHFEAIQYEYENAIESINGIYKTFEPIAERKGHTHKVMCDYAEELIMEAKPWYYKGEPIMSDDKFDIIENMIKEHRPNSHVLERVGYDVDKD